MLLEMWYSENRINEIKDKCKSIEKDYDEFLKELSDEVVPMMGHLLPRDFYTYMDASIYGILGI
jgi:hypothetical protein